MIAYCDDKIYVLNPSPEVVNWCRDNYRIANPEYYKRQAMGKWLGNTPEFFDLYERIGDMLVLPFGCMRALWDSFKAEISFKPEYKRFQRIDYRSGINLYPYQRAAVEAAERLKNGIIVMPCGAGKTQTALEIVARVGGRALWLTHTHDLLMQSLNRAKSVFDVGGKMYGMITGGKVDIGTGITFATIQTMAKLDLSRYKYTFDIVIVDECHKAVGSPTRVMQFYKVLSSISCRYKIGITATPKRADGLEKSMFALLGDIIHEVSRDEVSETTCPVEVRHVETGYTPNIEAVLSGDGTLNYSALIDDLTHDGARYSFVFDRIWELSKHGGVLVLANRVEYLQRLEDDLEDGHKNAVCLSTLGNSKAAKNIRKDALKKLNDGEVDIMLATYQLAKEGLDVPNLRYVVFATPEKDETTVMQAAGRVGRKANGKARGVVIDFVDDFGMLKGWSKKRNRYYKKLGYEIY